MKNVTNIKTTARECTTNFENEVRSFGWCVKQIAKSTHYAPLRNAIAEIANVENTNKDMQDYVYSEIAHLFNDLGRFGYRSKVQFTCKTVANMIATHLHNYQKWCTHYASDKVATKQANNAYLLYLLDELAA